MLTVDREFFLFLSCQLFSNGSHRPSEEFPDGLCHSLFVDLSNTTWARTELINKLSGNAFDAVTRIRPKSKYRDNYNTAFGAVTRIRPIIIITFGTANVVVHNGISFGTGTRVGYRRTRYCYSGAVPKISAKTMQTTVIYLVFENPRHRQTQDLTLKTHGQMMVLHLVPCKHNKHIVWYQ